MRVLSLFSGIGAHDLGLEWAGMEIVGQVEFDDYCTKILEKHWSKVPRWRDIRTVTARDIRRRCKRIDLITGGFPCQDISTAGKQAGIIEGEKSGLWREMRRLIRDLRPDWLLIENVPALRTNGADGVLASLEAIGYTCQPLVVGAWAVGAPHQRNRIWIMGYSKSVREREQDYKGIAITSPRQTWQLSRSPSVMVDSAGFGFRTQWTEPKGQQRQLSIDGAGVPPMGDTEAARLERQGQGLFTFPACGDVPDAGRDGIRKQSRWCIGKSGQSATFAFPAYRGQEQYDWEHPRTIESPVGRSVDGTARRLALKALGNANPPQVVAMIGRAIMQCTD